MEDIHTLLTTLCGGYNQRELAEALDVMSRTLRCRQVRENDPPPYLVDAIRQRLLPLADSRAVGKSGDFSFIDRFAGIDGFRIAFEAHGGP